MASVKFSILMPSLEDRAEQRQLLLDHLNHQAEEANVREEIEILVLIDRGEVSTGKKRNQLIEKAKGTFCAFVDDDDWVHDTYISETLRIIEQYPDIDCIGFIGEITCGMIKKRFIHSRSIKEWREDDYAYYRCPNHLNPIRTSIAKKFKFPDIVRGEDSDFSFQLRDSNALKSEYMICDRIMYHYRAKG